MTLPETAERHADLEWVGPVRFDGATALVRFELDAAEARRRRTTGGSQAVTSFEHLACLWELPGNEWVSVDVDLDRDLRQVQERHPFALTGAAHGRWRRDYVPLLRVDLIVAEPRPIRSRGDIQQATALVGLGPVVVAATDLSDEAAAEASFWGLQVRDPKSATESVDPQRLEPTLWQWLFAETVFDTWVKETAPRLELVD